MVKRNSQGLVTEYTRFEKARILGARALQISLGAPILVEASATIIDPLLIAELEYAAKVIPITVVHERAAQATVPD